MASLQQLFQCLKISKRQELHHSVPAFSSQDFPIGKVCQSLSTTKSDLSLANSNFCEKSASPSSLHHARKSISRSAVLPATVIAWPPAPAF
jgi:hypothetical protein